MAKRRADVGACIVIRKQMSNSVGNTALNEYVMMIYFYFLYDLPVKGTFYCAITMTHGYKDDLESL